MNMKKLILLVLTLAAVFSLTACGADSSSDEGPFTNMNTVDLDGNAFTTADFAKNKLTLVNAWNLGCSACIEEIPALDKLNSEYADKGVAVMGLYYNFGEALSDADRTEIQEIMANAEATYPQLLTSEDMMKTKELKRMSVFPMTFFVDSNGKIVDSTAGSRDFEDWAQMADKLLKKVEKDG